MIPLLRIPAWILLIGCSGKALDLDTQESQPDILSDITGDYSVQVADIVGCPENTWSWASELTISGEPEELIFHYGPNFELVGAIDSASGVTMEGALPLSSGTLTLKGEGVAFEEQQRWVLQIDVEGELSGDTPCTGTAYFEAEEVS